MQFYENVEFKIEGNDLLLEDMEKNEENEKEET